MNHSRFHTAALTLLSVLSITFLVGCATENESGTDTLTNEQFRRLYPRQYYESTSQSERQEMERQEAERAWREKNRR
jgi:hypothetical protein